MVAKNAPGAKVGPTLICTVVGPILLVVLLAHTAPPLVAIRRVPRIPLLLTPLTLRTLVVVVARRNERAGDTPPRDGIK